MSTAEELADAVVSFVRGFGLHRPEQTPCGFETGVAEAHALSELAHVSLRQMELGARLGLAKSTVSRIVTNLVERGWAAREPASDDGRGVRLTLTHAGRDAADRLSEARRQRMEALLEQVPIDRRSEVVDVLRLLQKAADASRPDGTG
ncbi:MAG: MarR family transcriptional regulator [Acidimicrobiia bacterium]